MLSQYYLRLSLILLLLMLSACQPTLEYLEAPQPQSQPVQIAFLPDVHFHDIYANFSDTTFPAPLNSQGKQVTIRTMAAQLNSTRLFNENYFALLAALDDLAARQVKLIVLPGDFSDDGQPAHVKGLSKILTQYQQQYGMQFFLTNGNHDPVKPFSRPAGKSDYLGVDGSTQAVYSPGSPACPLQAAPQHGISCTEQVKELGYQELVTLLADFGFYPKPDYLYWETPYSQYNPSSYQFNEALNQADLAHRQYEICLQGTGGAAKQPHYSHCHKIPDSSYLVEPVPGLWLLAVDANVYLPDPKQNEDVQGHQAFTGSGNAGYNAMLSHKSHVIAWMQQVAERAQATGKNLITFSHYPMTDFYHCQVEAIAELFGPTSMQLSRSPTQTTTETLAKTGITIHIGGHMHLNNTGTIYLNNARYLINIQAPSIAAYVPAYKLLTLHQGQIEAETIVLNDVPRFNELFRYYRQEQQYLASIPTHQASLWDPDILLSHNYREFANGHLKELTRQRFLPTDWPATIRQLLLHADGLDLLTLSQLKAEVPLQALEDFETLRTSEAWDQAELIALKLLSEAGLTTSDLTSWQGMDLALDFYRLRNAGQLALTDISTKRLSQYLWLSGQLQLTEESNADNVGLSALVRQQFGAVFALMQAFQHGAPNQHFVIDKATGKLTDLTHWQE
jgi:3',5'-cyclic AMP phosphodiesterase CpdA